MNKNQVYTQYNGEFARKHKCSFPIIRSTIGDVNSGFQMYLHNDINVFAHSVDLYLKGSSRKSVYEYKLEDIQNYDIFDYSSQINVWAVLGLTSGYPLGFEGIFGIYYTKDMDINELYIFKSIEVMHGRIEVGNGDTAPSLEVRCVTYKE